MASDGYVVVSQTQPKNIDTEDLTVGANEVQRQRVILVPGTLPRGCARYHKVSANGTNADVVKGSPCNLYGWRIFNAASDYTTRYVKLHNTSTTPTAGADVAETIPVQAGVLEEQIVDMGVAYDTGIGITIVKGIADDNADHVSADDVVVDLYVSP